MTVQTPARPAAIELRGGLPAPDGQPLDWNDYPYRLYPGFDDHDAWRLIATRRLDERNIIRSEQLVEDARLDHPVKHTRHDHPWCVDCSERMDQWQARIEKDVHAPPPPPTGDTWQEIRRYRSANGIADEQVTMLHNVLQNEQYMLLPEQVTRAASVIGVTTEQANNILDLLLRIEDRKDTEKRWRQEAIARAQRHLVIHGKPPADMIGGADDDEDEYLDADELDDLPEPEPLIDGILNRHSYAILRGRDGTYKSFTALDWALCLATGKRWQGRDVEPVRVLYIAGEGAYGLADRKNAWEAAWRTTVPPEQFTVRKSALNLFRPTIAFDRLLQRVTGGEYGLVVIDTLRRVSGGAEGNGTDMGTVIDNIEKIKRATADGSVLVIAHTDKNDNDSRGFSGIEDDADIVWHSKKDGDNLLLENTKMKDGPDGLQLHLRTVPSHGSLVIETAPESVTLTSVSTEADQQVLAVMRETFADTGATASELLEVTGLSKSAFYRARGRLLAAGHLIAVGSRSRPRLELPKSPDVPGGTGAP